MPKSGSLFVKYPLDRNFAFMVNYLPKNEHNLAMRYLDTPRDPTFNPSRFVRTGHNTFEALLADSKMTFYKISQTE